MIDPDDPNSGVPMNIGKKRVFRPIARKVAVERGPDELRFLGFFGREQNF